MKTTVEKAVSAFRVINGAKLSKMKDNDKFSVIRIMKEIKPVAVQYDDYVQDVAQKLKTEGIDEIQTKVQLKENVTQQEKSQLDKYIANVTKCLSAELQKEVTLDFEGLSNDVISDLVSSNDFTVAEILNLYEVIGQ